MLQQLDVENYQSLRKVSLRLRRFTVITGATGSGKSAIIRAVRHLTRNSRGVSYITRGEKTCSVDLIWDDPSGPCMAGLVRGAARGKDAYRLHTPGDAEDRVYTKLAGGVPEDISHALGLGELNFAGQFDSPFLLEESASEVARILGKLTNVTIVFEAAREANRRKARLADQLKDRTAELARLRSEAATFVSLPGRLQAVQAAEEAYARLQAVQTRGTRLTALLRQRAHAQESLARAAAAVQEVPGLEKAEQAYSRWYRLGDLMSEAQAQRTAYMSADSSVAAAAEQILGLEREYHRLLTEAGVCPMCGQEVH